MPHISKFVHRRRHHAEPFPSEGPERIVPDRLADEIVARMPRGASAGSPEEMAAAAVRALEAVLRVDLPLEIDRVVRRALEEREPKASPTADLHLAEEEKIQLLGAIVESIVSQWTPLAEQLFRRIESQPVKPLDEAGLQQMAEQVAHRVAAQLPPPLAGPMEIPDEGIERIAEAVARRIPGMMALQQALHEAVPTPGYVSDESADRIADRIAKLLPAPTAPPPAGASELAAEIALRLADGILGQLRAAVREEVQAVPRPPELYASEIAAEVALDLADELASRLKQVTHEEIQAIPRPAGLEVSKLASEVAKRLRPGGKVDPQVIREAVRQSIPKSPAPAEIRKRLESLVRASFRRAGSGRLKIKKAQLTRLAKTVWKEIQAGLDDVRLTAHPTTRGLKKILPAIVREALRGASARTPKGDAALSRRLNRVLSAIPAAIRKGMPKEVSLRGKWVDRMAAILARELGTPVTKTPSGVTKVRERVLSEVATLLPELVRTSVDRAFDTKVRMIPQEERAKAPSEPNR